MKFGHIFGFTLAVLTALVEGGRDAYAILGVPRRASGRAIKKAFREQSKKWHPDRNQDNAIEAEARFKDVAWAYEILSNETTRQMFDKGGEEALKMQQQGGPRGNPFGGAPFFFQQGPGGSQQFFFSPGGGFPGGFPFGGGGAPHGGPRRPAQLARVDWFEDTPVELIQGDIEADDMHDKWPDVFFIFGQDTEPVELAAGSLVSVAEALRSVVEVQALDCRNNPQNPEKMALCRVLRKSPGAPYEFQLLTRADLQQGRKALQQSQRPVLEASEDLDPELLMDWVLTSLPTHAQQFVTMAGLEKALTIKHDQPFVLAVTDDATINPQIKKLIAENLNRVHFGIVSGQSKTANRFRQNVADKLAGAIGEPLPDFPFFLHIADGQFIRKGTVEFLDCNESEFAIDLTMAKWVMQKKGQVGPYAESKKRLRPYTTANCPPTESKFCIILLKPGLAAAGVDSDLEVRRIHQAVQQFGSDAAVKFLYLDSKKQSAFVRAFGLEPSSKHSQLLAFRPKRRKFVSLSPRDTGRGFEESEISDFLGNVVDGSLLTTEGKAIGQVPEVRE